MALRRSSYFRCDPGIGNDSRESRRRPCRIAACISESGLDDGECRLLRRRHRLEREEAETKNEKTKKEWREEPLISGKYEDSVGSWRPAGRSAQHEADDLPDRSGGVSNAALTRPCVSGADESQSNTASRGYRHTCYV